MSNNNHNSTNTKPNSYQQYASTTPSVSSILNLPQVQDKKKKVSGSGLAGISGLAVNKTAGRTASKTAVGLAVSKPSTISSTLKSKPKTSPASLEDKLDTDTSSATVNLSVKTEVIEPSKTVTTKISDKPSSTVKSSNVVKAQSKKSHNKLQQTTLTTSTSATDTFNPAHWRLFVGNLGPEVSESLLLTTFQNPYPSTSKVLLVRDWKSQKSKGFAFVAFADGKEFLKALKEMNGKWIGNRQCIIKKSEHQPKLL